MKNSISKKYSETNWNLKIAINISKSIIQFPNPVKRRQMKDQLIAPPARVWEKIEKILDQQDERRLYAKKVIAETFSSRRKLFDKKTYVLTAAGLTVIAGLILIIK